MAGNLPIPHFTSAHWPASNSVYDSWALLSQASWVCCPFSLAHTPPALLHLLSLALSLRFYDFTGKSFPATKSRLGSRGHKGTAPCPFLASGWLPLWGHGCCVCFCSPFSACHKTAFDKYLMNATGSSNSSPLSPQAHHPLFQFPSDPDRKTSGPNHFYGIFSEPEAL